MKFVLVLLLISNIVASQSIETRELKSFLLNQQREILIYTPKGYKKEEGKKVNVIYVFDSQSREMFDYVHSTISFLKPYGVEYLVVGIVSPYLPDRKWYRNTEMLPAPDHPTTSKKWKGNLGKADSLLMFFENELIPYVENEFHTYADRTAIGHSNSATFVLHSFLEKPNLFQNIIALSPNLVYDEGQISRRVVRMECGSLISNKFLFVSNANEADDNGWKDWKNERDKFYSLLEDHPCSDKLGFSYIELTNQDHMKSFPEAALTGLRNLVNHQFYDVKKIQLLLKHREIYDHEVITADVINSYAYENYYIDNNFEAIELLDWGIGLFPNDDNLFDSKGEILEYLNRKSEALNSYKQAKFILIKNKNNFDNEEYEKRLTIYNNRIGKIE